MQWTNIAFSQYVSLDRNLDHSIQPVFSFGDRPFLLTTIFVHEILDSNLPSSLPLLL